MLLTESNPQFDYRNVKNLGTLYVSLFLNHYTEIKSEKKFYLKIYRCKSIEDLKDISSQKKTFLK